MQGARNTTKTEALSLDSYVTSEHVISISLLQEVRLLKRQSYAIMDAEITKINTLS